LPSVGLWRAGLLSPMTSASSSKSAKESGSARRGEGNGERDEALEESWERFGVIEGWALGIGAW
jgi:hypothetical protein